MRKLLAAGTVMLLLALGSASASSERGGESGSMQQPWKADGSILVHGATYFTLIDWNLRCPELPATQGLGGYVFEIPGRFATGNGVADVRTTGGVPGPLGAGYFMGFNAAGCDPLGTSGESAAAVPRGTRYVYVTNHLEAPVEFELTLRNYPGGHPHGVPSSPRPTGSPRPTPAPSTPAPSG